MKMINKFSMVCALAIFSLAAFFATGCRTASPSLTASQPRLLKLSGNLIVHDPSIIRDKNTYYIFCTGGGWRGGIIPIRCSTNLLHWTLWGSVFQTLPKWVHKAVPRARGIWAPDISYFHGQYHLYYAVSSFGVNQSAIGLAVNDTLNPADPRYQWVDRGMVLRSRPGIDDFNAIDPNIVIQDKQHIWLCWGSFWSGIKMRRINPATGKLSATDTNMYSLASRPRSGPKKTPPVQGAVEAPFIIPHGHHWYLFASYGLCCRGTNSTYNVKVGRARKVTGPYFDRNGIPLTKGGGTQVVPEVTAKWHGAGGESVLQDAGTDYLVFHAYNAKTGRPRLEISTIAWDDGWPRIAVGP